MKHIFRIFVACAFALSLVSCEDFLGEKVTTSYTGSMSTSTKAGLEANLLGCHRQFFLSGFLGGHNNEWLATGSGLMHWNNTGALTNALERWTSNLKFTRFSQHPESYETFSRLYTTIYLCNALIKNLPGSPVEDSYKKEIEGEAYFIRAMAYFWLVRIYGDVTLTTVAPTTNDEVYGPRENFWTVYCQIVKDLGIAEAQMRSYERMVEIAGGNGSGRVCNYAATAMRSLVYLTIGSLLKHPDDNFWVNRTPDFSEIGINSADDAFRLAFADADKVIKSNTFELCPDYRQLFRWTEPEDWQLKERIYVIPRAPEWDGSNSGLSIWTLPNHYMGTSDAPNFGRCHPDRWFFQKWCERYGGTKGSEENNSNIYTKCPDPRLEASMIYNTFTGNNMAKAYCYPSNNRIYFTQASGATNTFKNYGYPFCKKYYDPTFDNSVGSADFYIMRYAEVFLIAAEAKANLGETQEAIDYVNVILERARRSRDGSPAAEPRAWEASDFETQEDLLNAIFWERCFELNFEQHEYFDTHRMGAKWLAENIAKPKNVFLYEPEQCDKADEAGSVFSGYRTLLYGSDFKYDEDPALVRKGLINAYPHDELVYNPYLDITKHDPNTGQNPEEVYWR